MVYIPKILDYKPFYIQADGDQAARDTTEWGLIAKVNPYPLLPNPKSPFANEWFDEHGDDEWCNKMYYEPIEFSVSFCVMAYDGENITAEEEIRESVENFFSLIKEGQFSIYDSYSGIGRQKVRYAGYSEEEFTRKGNKARAIFEIRFKANDPVTRMELTNGKIAEKQNG
jgi:hypothetical protein